MFDFVNLDERTRSLMVKAIEEAEQSHNIYYSPRLNDEGKVQWAGLLKQAAKEHDEHWLAYELEANDLLLGLEVSRRPKGGYSIRHIPNTAAETAAENQFNRFYMLALCKRARADGIAELEVYRARESSSPRSESESMIGDRISVDDVEAQLRDAQTSVNSPLLRPNSGISLKIP